MSKGNGVVLFDVAGGAPDPATAVYEQRDMIGTLRGTTDSTGTPAPGSVYTAFGELATPLLPGYNPPPPRFGYAGEHGNQTDGTFPFLHVGHRYYDPASGRFLQRDPIGIEGGLNVYLYVDANPLRFVDPTGTDWIDVIINPIWKRLPPGFHEAGGPPPLDVGEAMIVDGSH